MKHKLAIFLLTLVILIVIVACSATPPSPTTTVEDVIEATATTTEDEVLESTEALESTEVLESTESPEPCDASDEWVTNPNPPDEVPLGADAQICQFHQFAWQWFIALLNEGSDGERVYQDEQNYPLLLITENSCTATDVNSSLFVRLVKDDDGQEDDFILPERIDQAGANAATIYDQNGNVVYYEVRFSRNECDLASDATMFPAGTFEIKVSWRVITEEEKSSYVWITADIDGNGTIEPTELLGMVGYHLVISTELHPEFIWATFEHKQNAPDCQTAPAETEGWSFTSETCAAELPNSVTSACNFNIASTNTVLSGGPSTEICRVYHDASSPGDNQYDTNVAAIDNLNEQLVGVDGFITTLPDTNPLAILQNYELVGALWESDVTQPSSDLANQRGSIQLANTTMETTFQQGFGVLPYTGTSDLQPAANCFACHNYTPNNNIGLSHIFTEINPTPVPTATPSN